MVAATHDADEIRMFACDDEDAQVSTHRRQNSTRRAHEGLVTPCEAGVVESKISPPHPSRVKTRQSLRLTQVRLVSIILCEPLNVLLGTVGSTTSD